MFIKRKLVEFTALFTASKIAQLSQVCFIDSLQTK